MNLFPWCSKMLRGTMLTTSQTAKKNFLLIIATILGFFSSCNSSPVFHPGGATENAIFIDRNGFSLQPENEPSRKLSFLEVKKQADHIKVGIEQWSQKLDARKNGKERIILISIHGGLNSLDESYNRSQKLIHEVLAHSDKNIYPIIVNWDSGLWSSYWDHLFYKDNGHHCHWSYGILKSPFFLTYDLCRAVIHLPMTAGSQLVNHSARTFKYNVFMNHSSVKNGIICAANNKEVTRAMALSSPDGYYSMDSENEISSYITFPVQWTTGAFVDSMGTPAWYNMIGSTKYMFNHAGEFNSQFNGDGYGFHGNEPIAVPRGCLTLVLNKIQSQINADKEHDYKIILIGHSMGTIIANNMLVEYPDLPYKDIVYMGAACTFSDVQKAVFPVLMKGKKKYLEETHACVKELFRNDRKLTCNLRRLDLDDDLYSSKTAKKLGIDPGGETINTINKIVKSHQDAKVKFYSLSLSPMAERDESNAFNFAPKGSLLVWLDDMFATNETPLDRTFGRWENLMACAHLIPVEIRNQVTLKRFPYIRNLKANPITHGGFDDVLVSREINGQSYPAYWEQGFWEISKGAAIKLKQVDKQGCEEAPPRSD